MSVRASLLSEVERIGKVASIRLASVTPARIGGYTTDSLEGPRGSAIKGLWRWWARATVGGAVKRKLNRYISMEEADLFVSKVLGGTINKRGDKIKSKYQIMVKGVRLDEADLGGLLEIPRVNLLLMGEKSTKKYNPSLNFTLDVYCSKEPNIQELKFAVTTLMLSLMFSGVGSMLSRGFGKLRANLIPYHSALEDLKNVIDRVYRSGDEDELRSSIRDLVGMALDSAEALIEGADGRPAQGWPPFGILDTTSFEVLRFGNRSVKKELRDIGLSTLKASWKLEKADVNVIKEVEKMGFRGMARRHASKLIRPGGTLHTWILGLPRSQELFINPKSRNFHKSRYYMCRNLYKKKIKTGYLPEFRRLSPIYFSVIRVNDGSLATVLWKFPAQDLVDLVAGHGREKLQHQGVHSQFCPDSRRCKVVTRDVETYHIEPRKERPSDPQRFAELCFEVALDQIRKIMRGG